MICSAETTFQGGTDEAEYRQSYGAAAGHGRGRGSLLPSQVAQRLPATPVPRCVHTVNTSLYH